MSAHWDGGAPCKCGDQVVDVETPVEPWLTIRLTWQAFGECLKRDEAIDAAIKAWVRRSEMPSWRRVLEAIVGRLRWSRR